MKILAIETSCDDTGIALVECTGNPLSKGHSTSWRIKVLKNIVSSQIKIHQPFGGVVPSLAKREHQKNLPTLIRQIFQLNSYASSRVNEFKSSKNSSPALKRGLVRGAATQKLINSKTVDMVAVTVGPGLEPALWAGIEFAKILAAELKKPLIGVNHLAGHLYSFLLPKKTVNSKHEARSTKSFEFRYSDFEFPAIVLLVSGGHTILLKMDSLTKWKKLGETRDDAVGEAFDKVARMLNLPYPGGPEIEKLAKKGDPKAINFPRPMLNVKNPAKSNKLDRGASFDFSFSGLKTSVLYYLRDLEISQRRSASSQRQSADAADVAASFQQAAIDVLVAKTERAAIKYGARSIILCGGVAANKAFRAAMADMTKKNGLQFLVPDIHFNTDNATMIAAAAYMSVLRKKKLPLKANGNLDI